MKRKILILLKWSLLIAYLIFMLSFAVRKKSETICRELVIEVDNKHQFVDKESVEKMLITNNISLDSCIINKLNFDEIEKIIESEPSVKEADIFCDYSGKITIRIKQRNPVMRIITNDNKSFYIDEDCSIMPVCKHYTANVIIVNGEFDQSVFNTINTDEDSEDETNLSQWTTDLFNFVEFVQHHELWRYQIQQIYINSDMEIELVPRVGNHIIILGDLINFKYKLGKLEAVYKKGFALTDWNMYSTINLKYSDQVICKKR